MISTTDLFLLGCCGLELPRGCAVYRDNRTPRLLDPVRHRPQAVPFRWVLSHYVALIAGKSIAAEIVGGAFKYTSAARLTTWSLTLPQVAATLAATLVAFNTFDPLHQRLIDHRM